MTKNDLLERFKTIAEEANARYEANDILKEFEKAIESNTNRQLETTKVYGYLNKIVENNKNFIKIIPAGTMFYRARKATFPKHFDEEYEIKIVGDDFTMSGLSDYEMKAPPLGVSTAGRNNIAGASYLYLASNAYTACCEVRPNYAEYICVATFRLNRDVCVIDFNSNDSVKGIGDNEKINVVKNVITEIMRALSLPNDNVESNIYKISQYISDFFRKNGYDGIQYMSLRGDGANLTLFNYADKYVSIIDKQWVIVNRIKYKFDYLNSGYAPLKNSKPFLHITEKNKIKMRINFKCNIDRYKKQKTPQNKND